MRKDRVQVWMPGGEAKSILLQEAKSLIAEWWDDPQLEWEYRILRACASSTWYQQRTPMLSWAVRRAVDWERCGLSKWQAALICFDADLVVSVGVSDG